MKKIYFVLAGIFAILMFWVIGSGMMYRNDVYIEEYAVSGDGSEMKITVGIATSMGYVRGYRDEGGGVKPHYLKFYSAWGGFNSRLGAKSEYVLKLDPQETEIYIYRGDGGYVLALKKDEVTGEWYRVNNHDNEETGNNQLAGNREEESQEDIKMSYKQITQEEAKNIMEDGAEEYIILDVRTIEEYEEGHIPGAICVPNETIVDEEPEELTEKDQMILVYCRSGRRSKEAAQKLAAMGYSDVREFGGIIDWPYEITTDK